MPAIGTTEPSGARNGRCTSGCVRRMISTAAQTITNASSVPMFTSSARMRSGRNAPMAATHTPVRMVDFHGVRNRSWTAPKNPVGSKPSRAMARKIRGWLSIITSSTEVIPATAPTRNQELRPGQADLAEGVRNRRVDVDLVVGDHAGEHGGDGDVENGAEHQRGDDADGHVARRIAGLLGVGRDRIEADVGEEDDRGAGQHADRFAAGPGLAEHGVAEEAEPAQAERREGMPVGRIHVERADADHEENDRRASEPRCAALKLALSRIPFTRIDGDDQQR